jgi:arginine exporter protein ArgO
METILIIYGIIGFLVALASRNELNTNVFSLGFIFLIMIWPVLIIKGLK